MKNTLMAGQTALITGGSKGIGRAIALALAQAGANIALLLKSDRAAADCLLDEIRAQGGRGAAFYGDITQRQQVAEQIAAIHARGLKAWVWTVDDPNRWRELLAWGIDGMITNDPAGLLRELDRV